MRTSSFGSRHALAGIVCIASAIGCASEGDDADGQASAINVPGTLAGDSVRGEGTDPSKARSDRVAAKAEVWGRQITLHVSDADNTAWASIENGSPGDETWLDKSIDGGAEWEGRVGKTTIPSGGRSWRTAMFGLDGTRERPYWGVVRACGKAENRAEISCTAWHRSKVNAATPIDAAATAMMQFYNPGTALWRTTGWWNSANVLTAMLDYDAITGRDTYRFVVSDVFEKNDSHVFQSKNYQNELMDDTGWWALAWVRAYDVTKEKRYLDMARGAADYLWTFEDGTCGGGIWWTNERGYKNAITNELYIKLAAALHNRIPGDTAYLAKAQKVWQWFLASGMINDRNRINDGLNDACKNNGDTEWTYNQGVILGALVELHRATKKDDLLVRARAIADATIADPGLNPGGILREPCEGFSDECGADGATFKGAFARNLGELNRYLPGTPYRAYIDRQVKTLYEKNRNTIDQYGLKWAGPFDRADAPRQQSAFEMLIAAHR